MTIHHLQQQTKHMSSATNKCDATDARIEMDAASTELAKFAWAISHPARVQILKFLLARNACMCGEIVASLPLAQSTVSQHLKILKESGLIQGEIDGPKVCYCVQPDQLDRLKTLVLSLPPVSP